VAAAGEARVPIVRRLHFLRDGSSQEVPEEQTLVLSPVPCNVEKLMARVHFVKKARKDQPGGIKAGESYYWWKFRRGGKHYSKTAPRPSQLTQSEYLSSAYALQEQVEDMKIDPGDLQAAADELRSVADEVRNLGQEQEDRIGNMPDSLQDGEVAEMMRGRAEACEELAGELESAADETEGIDPTDEEEPQKLNEDQTTELVSRVEDIIAGIGWNFEP
jgi:hypothetical protein